MASQVFNFNSGFNILWKFGASSMFTMCVLFWTSSAGIWSTKIHATFLKRQLAAKAESSGEEPIQCYIWIRNELSEYFLLAFYHFTLWSKWCIKVKRAKMMIMCGCKSGLVFSPLATNQSRIVVFACSIKDLRILMQQRLSLWRLSVLKKKWKL